MHMLGLNPIAPLGCGALSPAALRIQRDVRQCQPGKACHKWKTFRHACEAKAALALSDRALTVLNALLSFHPDTVLTLGSTDLVVFPSNRELSLRAHGIPASTLRRHIAALVKSGLIQRRDSPNGKRYARRAAGGDIELAFGFDLSPLVAAVDDLAELAARAVEERHVLDALREQVTLARRDIAKMLALGVERGVDADWPALHHEFLGLIDGRPRTPCRAALEPLAAALVELSGRILEILESHIEPTRPIREPSANASIATNPTPKAGAESAGNAFQPDIERDVASAVPVRLVAETCPDFVDYARHGLRTIRDVVDAAVIVRPLLGVSPSAWEEACAAMGQGPASVTLALILQRGNGIKNPGGYLRTLARRAAAGQFSIWPMLMALRGAQRGKDPAEMKTPAGPSFPDDSA